MFKSCKKMILVTTVIAHLTAGLSALAGGDGGHFNGPTLSPLSIPLSLDRGIKVKEAERIMSTCVEQLLRKLWSEANPGESPQLPKYNSLATGMFFKGSIGCESNCPKTVQSPTVTIYYDGAIRIGGTLLTVNTSWPKFMYDDKLDTDGDFDESGNLKIREAYLTNPRLVLPPNWNQPISLMNQETGRTDTFTLDLSDTVECLRGEFSKTATN